MANEVVIRSLWSTETGSRTMTAQYAEKLTNECTDVDFGDLKLYAVLVSDGTEHNKRIRYQFASKGDPKKRSMSTALWRGYVSIYRITREGELILEGFEYPFTTAKPDSVSEKAVGDFWLDMRVSFFFGSKMYVPFVDGKLVTDKDRWVTETRRPRL